MAIRIDTRQPSVLFVVLSHDRRRNRRRRPHEGSVPMPCAQRAIDFWIAVLGYALLLWRVLF